MIKGFLIAFISLFIANESYAHSGRVLRNNNAVPHNKEAKFLINKIDEVLSVEVVDTAHKVFFKMPEDLLNRVKKDIKTDVVLQSKAITPPAWPYNLVFHFKKKKIYAMLIRDDLLRVDSKMLRGEINQGTDIFIGETGIIWSWLEENFGTTDVKQYRLNE